MPGQKENVSLYYGGIGNNMVKIEEITENHLLSARFTSIYFGSAPVGIPTGEGEVTLARTRL